jgi:hypothetical protein
MVMAKERGADLLAIDELLTRLAVIDPQQSVSSSCASLLACRSRKRPKHWPSPTAL